MDYHIKCLSIRTLVAAPISLEERTKMVVKRPESLGEENVMQTKSRQDSNMAASEEVEQEVNNEEGISGISKVKHMFTLLTAKIDTLESGFKNKFKYMEKRVCEHITSSITEDLTEHINIIVEKKVREHLSPMMAEYADEISELKTQIETMQMSLEINKTVQTTRTI